MNYDSEIANPEILKLYEEIEKEYVLRNKHQNKIDTLSNKIWKIEREIEKSEYGWIVKIDDSNIATVGLKKNEDNVLMRLNPDLNIDILKAHILVGDVIKGYYKQHENDHMNTIFHCEKRSICCSSSSSDDGYSIDEENALFDEQQYGGHW